MTNEMKMNLTENLFMGRRLRVSNKKGKTLYVDTSEAKKYNFVQIGTKNWIPSLSIDIDFYRPIEEIYQICSANSIPRPTMAVKTTKGLHLHWLLSYPVDTRKQKQLRFYRILIEELAALFEADPFALMKNQGGRIFRNPLKHETSYTPNIVSMKDFYNLVNQRMEKLAKPIETSDSTSEDKKLKTVVSRKAVIKAKVGERNMLMFEYLRKLAYRNWDNEKLADLLEAEALKINSMMEEALPTAEIYEIITSIINFIDTKYEGKTSNEATIKFNRELAYRKKVETRNKILKGLIDNPMLTLRQIKKLSLRKLAKIFGISYVTVRNYKDEILSIMKRLIKNAANSHNVADFYDTISVFMKALWEQSRRYTDFTERFLIANKGSP